MFRAVAIIVLLLAGALFGFGAFLLIGDDKLGDMALPGGLVCVLCLFGAYALARKRRDT